MSPPRFIDPTADRLTRGGRVDAEPWQLVIPASMHEELLAHLFPGDGEEHAAVIAAGVLETSRGIRLLARDLVLAVDGKDFVLAKRAHRRLTPAFVNRQIVCCRNEGLAYLAIHNHGHADHVAFSSIDLASHERGYPALLDIARGQPVGALVLASDALAGDVWTPDRRRHPIGETVVLGPSRRSLSSSPAARAPAVREIDDRQARVYGAAGQALLARLKIGVIGAGGVGLPIVAHLSRMGVGHIVVVDPDRVELTNLPRLPESTRRDAAGWLTAASRPAWARRLGSRLSTPKVRLAKRVARRARRGVVVEALHGDVSHARVAERLVDCDHLFLAADSDVARSVFNALVFGFLVPGTQVGSKVTVGESGDVDEVFSVVRPVTADGGCLWCNGVISPDRLAEELLPDAVRVAQRYLPQSDAPAASVITLNALGVAQATHQFMLWATGLALPTSSEGDFRRTETRTQRSITELPRRDAGCVECGHGRASLRARGDRASLPLRRRG